MTRHLLLRCTLLLLLPSLMLGCGFALRGSNTVSSSYDELVLDLEQPNSDFARLLQRSLDVANVETSTSTERSNQVVLSVSSETVANRIVTVNPRARASQYELRLSVDIAINQADEILLAPETLMVERIIFEDIANLAGSRGEVQLILSEMRRDLVDQLMRRLEASNS